MRKIDFISHQDTMKMVKNEKEPIYLAVVRTTDFENVPKKRSKIKSKTYAGAAHGLRVRNAGC